MTHPPAGRRASDVPQLPAWLGRWVLGILTAIMLSLLATAWSSKADRIEVDALNAKMDRVLDLLCAAQPAARACK